MIFLISSQHLSALGNKKSAHTFWLKENPSYQLIGAMRHVGKVSPFFVGK